MNVQTNITLIGANNRPFLLDFFKNPQARHLIIFCHGFKGFKDWGAWDAVGQFFAEQDCHFVKFNFSHNGTTLNAPLDFEDLEAFGQNNYSKELFDLQVVIDWVKQQKSDGVFSFDHLHLVGHSRGGPIALISGIENEVETVTTWAGVSDLSYVLQPPTMEEWTSKGVHFIYNGRTKQQMPLYKQFGEDIEQNKTRYDLSQYEHRGGDSPKMHFIHGTTDQAVSLQAMKELKRIFPNAHTTEISDAGHTFGAIHPMPDSNLPEALHEVCQVSLRQITQCV